MNSDYDVPFHKTDKYQVLYRVCDVVSNAELHFEAVNKMFQLLSLLELIFSQYKLDGSVHNKIELIF